MLATKLAMQIWDYMEIKYENSVYKSYYKYIDLTLLTISIGWSSYLVRYASCTCMVWYMYM